MCWILDNYTISYFYNVKYDSNKTLNKYYNHNNELVFSDFFFYNNFNFEIFLKNLKKSIFNPNHKFDIDIVEIIEKSKNRFEM